MPPEQQVSASTPVPGHADDWTVKRILDWTTEHLSKHGSESPRLDAEIMLSHARGCRRIELYTRYDEPLTDRQRATMRDLVRRRSNSEPVAYLVGYKEFYSLPFKVTKDVLIPRPETETLVLEAIEIAKASSTEKLSLLDLCTGSGCIAVAAAHGSKRFNVVATDLSEAALAIARENAERNGVADRIEFRHGDLFHALPTDARFDLIVSNPPYVTDSEYESLAPDIRLHEPTKALLAGADGLDILRQIADNATTHLNAAGHLLLELDPQQAKPVAEMLKRSFREVRIISDLAGKSRVLHAAL